jgi:hypothetical protein
MVSMTRKSHANAINATMSTCDGCDISPTHPLSPQQSHEEIATPNSQTIPCCKRRIRSFAVLTATMATTLLWWQAIVLLQFLPQSAVGAATVGGSITPPPPPRPPNSQQNSSEITTTLGKASAISSSSRQKASEEILPPPPPPRVISKTSKDEGVEASESHTAAEIEYPDSAAQRRPLPPPPPPARISTEIKERTTREEKESSSSVVRASEAVKKSETAHTPHRQQRVDDLHQSVRQQQQNQHHNQRQYQQDNTLQTNYYYPQQQEQLITRHQVRQGHAPPQRPVPSSFATASASDLASTLKGLWGKVERSLDDLAGLEDSLAGQAQKLVTSAISTASAASKLSPSALRSLAQSGAVAAATPLGKRNNRRKGPSIADGTNVPLKPYGQKYEIAREAKEKKEQQQKEQFQPASIVSSKKRAHHLLYSGGGATSSPFGYPQDHPSSPSSGDDDGRTVEAPGDSADAKAHPGSGKSYGATAAYDLPPPEYRGPPSPSDDSYGGQRSFHPESQASNRAPPANRNPIEKRYSRDVNGMSLAGPARDSALPQPRREPQQDPSARDLARPQTGREPQQDPRDPHSRNNRIPWDTSPSSPNRQAPPSSHHPRSPQPPDRPDYRYEDRDTPSWKRALKCLSLPPLPNLGNLRMPRFRRSSNAYSYANLDAWESTEEGGRCGGIFGFFRRSSSPSSSFSSSSNVLSRNKKQDTNDGQPPLVASMLSRCNNGKTMTLLRSEDEKAIKIIGRYKAILDILFLVSILLGFKLLSGFDGLISLPPSWHEMLEMTLPKVGSALNELLEGSWALFAFLYAALFKYSSERLLDSKIDSLASTVATSVKEESEYSQLYLRLLAATPMDRHLPDRLASIAKTQVSSLVAKSRLNSFVGIVLASLTVMTVSAVGPILMAIGSAITKIVLLEEWRRWPVPWEGLFGAASVVIQNLFHALESRAQVPSAASSTTPFNFPSTCRCLVRSCFVRCYRA